MTQMMTTQQAADELGVSRRRVTKLIADGRLLATKVGRDYVIDRAHLDDVRVRDRKGGWPKGRPRDPVVLPQKPAP